jgi:predicted small secreted protein
MVRDVHFVFPVQGSAMNRLVMIALLLSSLTLTACNTIQGMGRDTRETGDFISGESPREAYHQDARDF